MPTIHSAVVSTIHSTNNAAERRAARTTDGPTNLYTVCSTYVYAFIPAEQQTFQKTFNSTIGPAFVVADDSAFLGTIVTAISRSIKKVNDT